GAVILPVDSEHNAVFQMLAGRSAGHVRRILLTASGGPFRGWKREDLASVTPEQALRHPNWSMGTKITIDSATLMNKGLEVIEACQLYGMPLERVEVALHPQSLVHSLAEFADGSLMAHLGTPDMRMAIGHCLAWPRCLELGVAPLDLLSSGPLTFEAPDEDNFPCLSLARRALRYGRGMPAALNAANEAAVELFLSGRIAFLDIPVLISDALDSYESSGAPSLPDGSDSHGILKIIEKIDADARRQAMAWGCVYKKHTS
ncbi:MAG: 1-deoxy-D-xylulose-5-phosphate reductoisomerase, partial [Desulfovibrionaceae bacterium]|nr:1-deoxy-D-xylulose-5-phosphate reductoisomerase [Desulfovibrionaceae bacterium]